MTLSVYTLVSILKAFLDCFKTARVKFMKNLSISTAQKMKLSIKDFFQETADLVSFIKEILNGKFHFLCSEQARIKAIGFVEIHIDQGHMH